MINITTSVGKSQTKPLPLNDKNESPTQINFGFICDYDKTNEPVTFKVFKTVKHVCKETNKAGVAKTKEIGTGSFDPA